MNKAKVIILIIVFLMVALWGLVKHSLDRGGGWIGGGPVDYAYHYGRAYSWEPGYDSLHGIFKGRFPETKCGSVFLDTFEWQTRRSDEGNKYISGDDCKRLMKLSEFIDRYSNNITVGELRIKKDMLNEEEQIAMFNEWKNQKLLDDVRYKNVTVYDCNNIWDFVYRVLIIPSVITAVLWLILKLIARNSHASTKSREK